MSASAACSGSVTAERTWVSPGRPQRCSCLLPLCAVVLRLVALVIGAAGPASAGWPMRDPAFNPGHPGPRLGWCRLRPLRYAAAASRGTWRAGRLRANHRGSQISVTEPSAAPKFSASLVSGQRNPFAAKIKISPATTVPAMAARRSVRLATPAYSTYIMQDSIENHARVCTVLTSVSAVSVPLRPPIRGFPELFIVVSPPAVPSCPPGLPAAGQRPPRPGAAGALPAARRAA
jgi:hypothetical protein